MMLSKNQYNEIMDMVSLFAGMCDTYLQQHPVSKINPNVKMAVEEAVNSIIRISDEVEIAYKNRTNESYNSGE